jgi:hypothetical protein
MGRKEENFIFVGCEDGDLLEKKKKKGMEGIVYGGLVVIVGRLRSIIRK